MYYTLRENKTQSVYFKTQVNFAIRLSIRHLINCNFPAAYLYTKLFVYYWPALYARTTVEYYVRSFVPLFGGNLLIRVFFYHEPVTCVIAGNRKIRGLFDPNHLRLFVWLNLIIQGLMTFFMTPEKLLADVHARDVAWARADHVLYPRKIKE